MNKFIRQVIFLKWNVISVAKKIKIFSNYLLGHSIVKTTRSDIRVDSSSCNGATPTSELKEIKRVESSCVNRDKNYW